LAFGPVPSRRLGRSLGINNIPAKTCSYSCVYCQLGRTVNMTIERQIFYRPEDIVKEVKMRVSEVLQGNERIDFLTFVPDGEPTLDINLGRIISALKEIGVRIAVLTNASLLWREDVRKDLLEADLASLKIDAVSPGLWRKINRPHKDLKLNTILEGIVKFTDEFKGTIITETMLIKGLSQCNELRRTARFIGTLKGLNKAYLMVPTRPPAESWVKPADEETINFAFQVFTEELGSDKVECLTRYEEGTFTYTGSFEEELLSITAVHPISREALVELMEKAKADWSVIDRLLRENKLVELEYRGRKYYMRRSLSRN